MNSEIRQSDTAYGRNVRYTVRFHVVSIAVGRLGLAKPVDEYVEKRVVTPFGEPKAIAIAATVLDAHNPELIYNEVEVADVEHEFTIASEDYPDRVSLGR